MTKKQYKKLCGELIDLQNKGKWIDDFISHIATYFKEDEKSVFYNDFNIYSGGPKERLVVFSRKRTSVIFNFSSNVEALYIISRTTNKKEFDKIFTAQRFGVGQWNTEVIK
jgi:hypothetical protein